jgi:hypothetical protein
MSIISNPGPPIRSRAGKIKWSRQHEAYLRANYSALGSQVIASDWKVDVQAIFNFASRRGIKTAIKDTARRNTRWHDIGDFLDVRKPFIAYILGYWWADGHVRKKSSQIHFTIAKRDFDEIADFYRTQLESNYSLRPRTNPKHSLIIDCHMTNRNLSNFLKAHDYTVKSGASADKILTHIPEHLRHYWWRGYFDGDGCITLKTPLDGEASFAAGYHQDWTFLEQLSKDLGIGMPLISRRHRRTGGSSEAIFQANKAVLALDRYIYQGDTFGLSRKREKFKCLRHAVAEQIAARKNYFGVSTQHNHQAKSRYSARLRVGGRNLYMAFPCPKQAARQYDQWVIDAGLEGRKMLNRDHFDLT